MNNAIASLVQRLKASPTRSTQFSREAWLESWDQIRDQSLRHLTDPTLAVLAALILHEHRYTHLLSRSQNTQLLELLNEALENFQREAHPNNQIGKVLVEIAKET